MKFINDYNGDCLGNISANFEQDPGNIQNLQNFEKYKFNLVFFVI